MLDDLAASEQGSPARLFNEWRLAVAMLTEAERRGAPYQELVRLSEQVIRTRNVLALDRQAIGLALPAAMVRHIELDEDLLLQRDDRSWVAE
jgi:hypothetical protein